MKVFSVSGLLSTIGVDFTNYDHFQVPVYPSLITYVSCDQTVKDSKAAFLVLPLQGLDTFELDTNQTKYALDDIKEQWDDNSSFRDLQGTPCDDLIVLITTSSQYMGTLTICVLPEILDCSFQTTT